MSTTTTHKNVKTWYSSIGGQQEEGLGFYNNEDFDWVPNIEANWEVIKGEVDAFMQKHDERIKPYFNKKLVSGPKKWKAFAFRFWGWKVGKNAKECPETVKLLEGIPNLVSYSISILEPDTQIHMHKGDTNAICRCHLALSVPAPLPTCGFESGGEQRSWEEGKIFVFNDASDHQAWNNSNERRYVMLFDVIRPEFVYKKYRICAVVLAALLMQLFAQKTVLVRKAPRVLQGMMLFWMAGWLWLFLRIRNGLSL